MEIHERKPVTKSASDENVQLIHDGIVYDVTAFLSKHPGGSEVLLRYANCDVTDVMKASEPHRHSKAAYSILESLSVSDANHGIVRQTSDDKNHTDVDWSMPIAGQVSKLGSHYYNWVHQPVKQDIRFFQSDLLEALTSCSWYVVPIMWLPIMWYFLTCSVQELQNTGGEIWLPWLLGGVLITEWHVSLLFLSGILLWTLLEYTFHRWLFHFCPPANYPTLIIFHFLIHGQHHKSPMDKRRLVFPPAPASIIAVILWVAYRSIFSPAMTMAVFAGSIFGYIAYDLTHYYLHHGTPWLAYFRSLKHHHMKHHFGHPNSGFGISSKLWDVVFRTKIPSE